MFRSSFKDGVGLEGIHGIQTNSVQWFGGFGNPQVKCTCGSKPEYQADHANKSTGSRIKAKNEKQVLADKGEFDNLTNI